MVKVNFIATLMVLQGFFFLYAETTTSVTANGGTTATTAGGVSPTTTQTTTSSVTANEGTTATTAGGVSPTTTQTTTSSVTANGGTTTTTAGGVSPTTTQTTTSSSSVVVNKKPGPQVKLTLNVTINCTGGHLSALNISLQVDIKAAYVKAEFKIKSVITASISCNSPLNMVIVLDLSFYSGNPTGKTIQGVFEVALKTGSIGSLTTDNTVVTFLFVGTTITYKPKSGQCQEICCDGAGGEMTVVPGCSPADKCEGIVLPEEKKEDGHCPGDSKATCTVKCEDDSGGIQSPSFAVVVLLTIASFTKTAFY